jgi:hypothetical protein
MPFVMDITLCKCKLRYTPSLVALAEIAVVCLFFFTPGKSSLRGQLWYDNGSILSARERNPNTSARLT